MMELDEKFAPPIGVPLKMDVRSRNVESKVHRYSTSVDGVDVSKGSEIPDRMQAKSERCIVCTEAKSGHVKRYKT